MPRRPPRIVENKWNCTSCSTQNRGRDMKCKSCGSPKEKDEKYDLGDTSKTVTDQEMLKQAHAGVNWSCSYCQYDNRALGSDPRRHRCVLCGASRMDKADHQAPKPAALHTKAEVYAPRDPASYEAPVYVPKAASFAGSSFTGSQAKSRANLRVGALLILIGLVVAAVVGGLVWLFSPHEHDAQVTAIHWQYTRTLEERHTRSGSGWGHPGGAFNVRCNTRQRGTENCRPHDCRPHQESYDCDPYSCNCHESCHDLGNGYSSCSESCSTCYRTCTRTEYDTCYDQCPVYDDWCTYNYHEWVTEDHEVTSGNDHSVRWGTRLTAEVSIPQRITTNEQYTVNFSHEDDHWTYGPPTLAEFRRFNVGAVWDVKTNYAGMIWPVHPEPSR